MNFLAHAVLAGDDPAEARLRELVTGPVVDEAEHAEALQLLRHSSSLARATLVASSWARLGSSSGRVSAASNKRVSRGQPSGRCPASNCCTS